MKQVWIVPQLNTQNETYLMVSIGNCPGFADVWYEISMIEWLNQGCE